MNPKGFKSFLGAIYALLLVTIFGGFAPFGISARADTIDGVSHRAVVSWLLHDDWHIIRDWKNFKKAMTESADIKFIHILKENYFEGVLPKLMSPKTGSQNIEAAFSGALNALKGKSDPELFVIVHSHGRKGYTSAGHSSEITHRQLLADIQRWVNRFDEPNLTINLVLDTCFSGSIFPVARQMFASGELRNFQLNILTAAPANDYGHSDIVLNSLIAAGRILNEMPSQSDLCIDCTSFQKLALLIQHFQYSGDAPKFWSSKKIAIEQDTKASVAWLKAANSWWYLKNLFSATQSLNSEAKLDSLSPEELKDILKFHINTNSKAFRTHPELFREHLALLEGDLPQIMAILRTTISVGHSMTFEEMLRQIPLFSAAYVLGQNPDELKALLIKFSDNNAWWNANGVDLASNDEYPKPFLELVSSLTSEDLQAASRNRLMLVFKQIEIFSRLGMEDKIISLYYLTQNEPDVTHRQAILNKIAMQLVKFSSSLSERGEEILSHYYQRGGLGSIFYSNTEVEKHFYDIFHRLTGKTYNGDLLSAPLQLLLERSENSSEIQQKIFLDLIQLFDSPDSNKYQFSDKIIENKFMEFLSLPQHKYGGPSKAIWEKLNSGLLPNLRSRILRWVGDIYFSAHPDPEGWFSEVNSRGVEHLEGVLVLLSPHLRGSQLEGMAVFKDIAKDRKLPNALRDEASKILELSTIRPPSTLGSICNALLLRPTY